MAVAGFDDILTGYVTKWVASSAAIGSEIGTGAELVEGALKAQRDFIAEAVKQKKPSDEKAMEMCGPTSEKMGAVSELHEKHQRGPWGKHLQMLAEGVPALGWVMMPTPVPHVKETTQACMFYGNKIMMAEKGKDDKQVQWVKDFKEILEELAKYVKAFHTTGVAWNSAAGGGAPSAAAAAPASAGESVDDYDQWLREHVEPLVPSGTSLSPDVGTMSGQLLHAFRQQRAFIAAVAECKKPDDAALQTALGPQIDAMGALQPPRKATGPYVGLLTALEECAQAVAWVSLPTPVPHVVEITAQVQFRVNKVLMASKGDDKLRGWAAQLKAALEGLQGYVKAHHRSGLAWNPKGKALSGAPAAKESAPAPAAAAPAPAKKEEKPEEKKKPSAPAPAKKPAGPRGFPTGEARLELEGKKWVCEYQAGTRLETKEVEVSADKSQTLYVFGCQFAFIKVTGKINAINLYRCKKVMLRFESCIGQLEVTDCEGAEVQVTDKLPACSIDKSSEVMLYLSRNSLDVDITTCSSMCVNVTVPGKTDAEDPVELAIAEQFVHKVSGNKVTTACVEHSG
eukprot:TRINITY_DN821_c0_g2_i1.p1 TRINITY_DN821_c0_g2~~TRINITY_DN821_c0_g2_i1.p1  ORF type:complete len:590 (+),score=249.01 TRINITY_DN821_c0_g2_i1:69-1772(+)